MASASPAQTLVEITDPPVPNRSTPVMDWSFAEKLKATLVLIGAGVLSCAASWWLLHNGSWLWGGGLGLFGLFCVVAGLGDKSLKANCPFCGHKIGSIPKKDWGQNAEVRCETCCEYSQVHTRILRPMDPNSTSDALKFESPAFRNGKWPKGCVVCGAAPTHFDKLSKFGVGAAEALVGSLSVMRGSVQGIPYCAGHSDQMRLKISDKKLYFGWYSLKMMRRYVAANRARPTKGATSFT